MSATEPDSQARVDKALKAELDAKAEADELSWLMSDARGRRFMWRLLARAGIYRTSYTGEALSMAFKEGCKTEGLYLLTAITKHCPQRFSEMQRENLKHERRTESKAS